VYSAVIMGETYGEFFPPPKSEKFHFLEKSEHFCQVENSSPNLNQNYDAACVYDLINKSEFYRSGIINKESVYLHCWDISITSELHSFTEIIHGLLVRLMIKL
jgi:hypothetical protein